jgi:hypothetical protein
LPLATCLVMGNPSRPTAGCKVKKKVVPMKNQA